MNTYAWARRMAKVVAVTTVFAAAGTGVALAGTNTGSGGTTSGINSILGGNQLSVPVNVPVTVCGALAVLGDALGGCAADTLAGSSATSAGMTSGDNSILGGNQISVPVNVPVALCGGVAAVLAAANGGCTATQPTPSPAPSATGAAQPGDNDHASDSDDSGTGTWGSDSDSTGTDNDNGSTVSDSDSNWSSPAGGTTNVGDVDQAGWNGQPGTPAVTRSVHKVLHQTPALAQLSARTIDGGLPITGVDIAGLLALAAVAIAAGTAALVATGHVRGRRPARGRGVR